MHRVENQRQVTRTHTTRTTLQAKTQAKHSTALEGGAATVRATSHVWVGGRAEVSMESRVKVRCALARR